MTVNELIAALEQFGYFANKEIGYALLGAMETGLPLLTEGAPGVGKSSLATAAAQALGVPLIRVQCYEGITPDAILYDYDYQRQLLVVSAIRDKLNRHMADMSVDESVSYVAKNVAFFGKDFLLERPVLKSLLMPGKKILLIDEIDKASEEIEHALLETLSDFAMTIPEYGTIACRKEDRPIVILTSNRYRELSNPTKRRCIYLFIKQKTREEIKRILMLNAVGNEEFCSRIADYLYQISKIDLQHNTSISEGVAWAKFLKDNFPDGGENSIQASIHYTVGFLAKDVADRKAILQKVFGVSP